MIPMDLQFLSICYFHIHFYSTPTVEDEMFGKFEEMAPKAHITLCVGFASW